jgi:UDP-GlcNAc:undecaprenyl-phosphate/decaprenyl-phosphate GlcNAc-1-phosphate transferase
MTIVLLILCGAVTWAAMLVVLPVLRRTNVMDIPSLRSSHSVPVPRGGGLACVMGVGLTACVMHQLELTIIAVPLLMGALGLADDIRSLGPIVRLSTQALASGVASLIAYRDFGAPMWLAVVGGLFVVSYLNAFNFMDGVNGISALNGCVCGAWFMVLGMQHGVPAVHYGGAAVFGASAGFLPWNVPVARVFLGDAGSYFFGALIAMLAVISAARHIEPVSILAPLVIYLADTGCTLVLRARRGRGLMSAHREHAYQRLADHVGHAQSSLVTVLASGTCILIARSPLPSMWQYSGLLLVALVYLRAPSFPALEAAARAKVPT